jgi:hypothetical protein
MPPDGTQITHRWQMLMMRTREYVDLLLWALDNAVTYLGR